MSSVTHSDLAATESNATASFRCGGGKPVIVALRVLKARHETRVNRVAFVSISTERNPIPRYAVGEVKTYRRRHESIGAARCDPRKASHLTAVGFAKSAGARAGADDPGPSKGNILASSDCPHARDEAAGRKQNGEAIARTFGDTVGSFPDLVRPTLLCACKQPAIPYIGLHHE